MKRTSAFTAAMTSVGVALFFPIVTRADPFVWGKTPTSIVTGRYSHGARPSFRIPWATPCLQYRRSESLQSVAIISDFPPQAESWRPQSIRNLYQSLAVCTKLARRYKHSGGEKGKRRHYSPAFVSFRHNQANSRLPHLRPSPLAIKIFNYEGISFRPRLPVHHLIRALRPPQTPTVRPSRYE